MRIVHVRTELVPTKYANGVFDTYEATVFVQGAAIATYCDSVREYAEQRANERAEYESHKQDAYWERAA